MGPSTLRVLSLLAEERSLQELSMRLGWTPQRVRYHVKRLLARGLIEETVPGVYKTTIKPILEDTKIMGRLCNSLCRSLDPPPEGTVFLQMEPSSLDVAQNQLEWILKFTKSQLSGKGLATSRKYRILLILLPDATE